MSLWAKEVIEELQQNGVALAVLPGYELYGFWRDERAKRVYKAVQPHLADHLNELTWTLIAMDYVGHTDTNGRTGLPASHGEAK